MKTTLCSDSSVSAVRASSRRLFRVAGLFVSAGVLSATLLAQDAPPPDGNGRTRRGNQNGDPAANGGRGNFDPAAMQERMMSALREQFAVTDDAEWGLISERILKVSEIRRSAPGGGFGRGGMPGGGGGGTGGGGNRPQRQGATASPEVDALRSAVADKLPDAEIKSRLTRLREARKDNEAKLAKAQEDLRAVLTMRQEAIAVMAGLLP